VKAATTPAVANEAISVKVIGIQPRILYFSYCS